jgi:hypothetical protein
VLCFDHPEEVLSRQAAFLLKIRQVGILFIKAVTLSAGLDSIHGWPKTFRRRRGHPARRPGARGEPNRLEKILYLEGVIMRHGIDLSKTGAIRTLEFREQALLARDCPEVLQRRFGDF